MNKNRKWTKERLEKFRHTMAMKRKAGVKIDKQTVAEVWTTNNASNFSFMPNGVFPLLEKWNQEADETFRLLPLEKKAALLAQVKP